MNRTDTKSTVPKGVGTSAATAARRTSGFRLRPSWRSATSPSPCRLRTARPSSKPMASTEPLVRA